jgi:triosephosphate isomerase
MKKLIAGNWKMNGDCVAAVQLAGQVELAIAQNPEVLDRCDFAVCPPFVHLGRVKPVLKACALGAQDVSEKANGAVTGDISAAMLKDMGCDYVILGHSERRQYHAESDILVAAKAVAANAQGLKTIICVGETEAQRMAGQQNDIVGAQLAASLPEGVNAQNTVVAYEPVWAIGTGKTATPDDIRDMHAFIRAKLQEKLADGANIRILYGGSVKPSNAAEIFAVEHVNGALIGGASLKCEDFLGIAEKA